MLRFSPIVSRAGSQIDVDQLHIHSILSNQGKKIVVDHDVDQDEAVMLALGYKQEFKREFSLFSTFCVSFAVLGLLPSIASTMNYGTLVVGASPLPWIIAMIGVGSVALSLAEIASAYPTSGGLYYATKQLAPQEGSIGAFLSWTVGWSNWIVQITGAPSIDYGCACMILALRTYQNSDYSPSKGEIYGLSFGLMIIDSFISSMPTKWIAWFNEAGSISNMAFLFVVFVMLLAGNDRMHIMDVDTKFNTAGQAFAIDNQTDWPNGVAFLMSFLGVIWAMSGYDSPFHLAEETANAQLFTPRAIVMTAGSGGIIGWAFMFVIAFTIVDVNAIATDSLGQPFITYLAQVLPHNMVLAAAALTIISSFFMGQACMVAASRVTYAYSRDDCFPLSFLWKQVNPITDTPVNAVWGNSLIGVLLLLLIFAGEVAVGALFSVGAIAAFISFIIPVFLKITVAHNHFTRGPWNLGKLSRPIGIVSVAFVALMTPILCIPYSKGSDLDVLSMNWTVAVYFGPMSISTLWYLVSARKWFKGPKSNLDESYFQSMDNSEYISGLEQAVYSKEGAENGVEVSEKQSR
ncbi:hypothetical protein BABINDRAFT_162210 [Babjeviella inositovora NRRL Y-12698]|uniref:Amino acid permease/ SLC12A domain-containing protein n=1 Tax=Babjeviella inositovora NRRL Y-12698 TaxID=984486 RepID=A0A1E3QN90_9ASCO|nr:uncharacterized protein BABINDRAFT_162210 [Babjeviella inositovora NRRL Y-12698]ODQ79155.1 hypothetical protein BABINDRAFT_162210 [Babjeviella inositovora NRRL Y-12698]